ncbi:hypothetical protein ALC57_16903, partial [Trachymyrmex cornetzi]
NNQYRLHRTVLHVQDQKSQYQGVYQHLPQWFQNSLYYSEQAGTSQGHSHTNFFSSNTKPYGQRNSNAVSSSPPVSIDIIT